MKLFNFFIIAFLGFIFGQLGLKMTLFQNLASPIWPLAGFAFAVLIVYGRKYWPLIFLAALLNEMSKINYSVSWLSFAIAGSCTLEAMFAHFLFQYFLKRNTKLEHYNYPLALILSGIIATFLGSFLGLSILSFAINIQRSEFINQFITWWTGDFIGILTTTSFLLLLYQKANEKSFKLNYFKFIFAAILAFIFSYTFLNHNKVLDLLLFVFPLIVFIAVSLSTMSAYFFVFLIQFFAIFFTRSQIGPFFIHSNENNFINFQLFFAGLSMTVLVVDAIIKSSKEIRQSLTVMGIGWTLTFIFSVYFYQFKIDQQNDHFQHLVVNVESQIQSRFRDYIHVLQSGAALFKSDPNLSRNEWRLFAHNLDLYKNYPGINGIGIILPVNNGEEKSYFSKYKNLIPADLKFKSVPNVDPVKAINKFIISIIEPIEFNGPALGLDIGSEMNRRKAAELAIQSGEITMTNKIFLIQDKVKRPGFLMFTPIFSEYLDNNQISQKFTGFAYAPFVTEKFFNGVIESNPSNREIDFIVKDFDSSMSDNLLYISNPDNLAETEATTKINLGKVDYRILWKKGPAFSSPFASTTSIVTFIGFLISLLLGVVTSMITSIKERAEAIALEHQKEADKQRLMNIQASRLASLGEMASGVAHEINNPLAIIQGKSQQLNRTLSRLNLQNIEITEMSQSIISNTQRIAQIIKGLRSFARDGETDPFVTTEITSILEDTISLCQSRFANHNIEFRTPNLDDLKKSQILTNCRATQIGQVILNLLNNSFDAIENMNEKWIDLSVQVKNEKIYIRITDSGAGIPDDLKEKIMQPFFTTKEVGKGTGIGLSIAQGIISAHQGKLFIDDSSKNTTFVIELVKANVRDQKVAI